MHKLIVEELELLPRSVDRNVLRINEKEEYFSEA